MIHEKKNCAVFTDRCYVLWKPILSEFSWCFVDTKYKIQVHTADEPNAGTDANVFLTFFGLLGDSGKLKLDTLKDNFEAGS